MLKGAKKPNFSRSLTKNIAGSKNTDPKSNKKPAENLKPSAIEESNNTKTSAPQEIEKEIFKIQEPAKVDQDNFELSREKIKQTIYDFAIGKLGGEESFVNLLKNSKELDILLKGSAEIYILDNDSNSVLHHAARNKNNIFPFIFLSILIDSRSDNLSILKHQNIKNDNAFEYVLAKKNENNLRNLFFKQLICLIGLSSGSYSYNESQAAFMFGNQDIDQELLNFIVNYSSSFGTNCLMNNDFKVSREVFNLIRIIEINNKTNPCFLSSLEKSMIESLTDIKLENLKFLLDFSKESEIEPSKNDKESNTFALYSICDFLRKDENERFKFNPRFDSILSLTKNLLDNGANPNYEVILKILPNYTTPLLFFSSNNDNPRLIELLIDALDNPEQELYKIIIDEMDVLSLNARNRNFHNVEVILNRAPLLVNRLQKQGRTTLHITLENALESPFQGVSQQYCKIAKLLIERDASCKIKDKKGITSESLIQDLVAQKKVAEDYFILKEENFRNIGYVEVPFVKKLSESEKKQQEEEKEQRRKLELEKLTKYFGNLFGQDSTFREAKSVPIQQNISQICYQINEEELQIFEEKNGFNLAFLAAKFGKLEDLTILMEKGFNLNYQDSNGLSLLSHAISHKSSKELKENDSEEIIRFLISQENLEFGLVKTTLKNFAQTNYPKNYLKIILNSENVISKAVFCGKKEFNVFVDDLNKSANQNKLTKDWRGFFKEEISGFSKKVLDKINHQKDLKANELEVKASETNSSEKPISKNERKKIAAEERKNRELEEKEKKLKNEAKRLVKKQSEEISLAAIEEVVKNLDEISDEQSLKLKHLKLQNEVNKELPSHAFLATKRDISSIEDLPWKIQPIIKNLVSSGFDVAVKGSYIYRNSEGKKVKKPNDLDLEIFVQGLAQKSNEEIVQIIQAKFSPNTEFEHKKFDERSAVFVNSENEEIKIFRSDKPKIFTATFSSQKKELDVSFYDSEVLPLPNLTWTTSIDARRIRVVNDENFSLKHDYVDNFKYFYPNFAEDRLAINPYSQKLFLRLALIASKGLIGFEEIEKSIEENKIDVLKTMFKEFGLVKKNDLNPKNQIKAVFQNWIENHRLFDEKSRVFFDILRQIILIPSNKDERELNSQELDFLKLFDKAKSEIAPKPKPNTSLQVMNANKLNKEAQIQIGT